MAPKDYYRILKIRWGATAEEVREAYRRLARQHHPDLNPGDVDAVERLKEINEAYEVLSDPLKQQEYEWLHKQEERRTAYRSEPNLYRHSDTDLNLPVVTPPPRSSGWDLLERFFQIMDDMDEAVEMRWKRFRGSWEDS